MRIIQVSAYYPPRLGGMQNVVMKLSSQLASKGHEVTVYTSKIGVKKSARLKNTKGVTVNYFMGFDFAHSAIVPGIFFAIIKSPKDSVIHIHTPRPFVAEAASFAAKVRGIPYIVQVHSDIQPLGIFKFLIPIYKKFFWKWVMRNAYAVAFLSSSQEKSFKEEFNLSQTTVIPNGVDDEFYFDRKELNSVNKVKLLFVGRLNNQKNLDFLIKAYGLIKNAAVLNLVGEGEMRSSLETLIKVKNIKNEVNLVGKLEGKQLIKKYRESDLYVITSNFEGQSLAMLEAMASSLPILALDAPGVTEFVQNVGVIVNQRDASIFASEIDKIINNRAKRLRLMKRSFNYVSDNRWSVISCRYIDLYEEIIYG